MREVEGCRGNQLGGRDAAAPGSPRTRLDTQQAGSAAAQESRLTPRRPGMEAACSG